MEGEQAHLIFALEGVQCSGKSTLRATLAPFVHWHASSDEKGSVATLAQELMNAMHKYKGRFVALVDRCNKTAKERNNLEQALAKAAKQGQVKFMLQYITVPQPSLAELVHRFSLRKNHPFSPETVGMLKGMEIIADGCRSFCPIGIPWTNDLISTFNLNINSDPMPQGVILSATPHAHKVVYSGFGVILTPQEVEIPATVPGKFIGTHVTYHFGNDKELPEGVLVDLTVTGKYGRRKDGLVDLFGLLESIHGMGKVRMVTSQSSVAKVSSQWRVTRSLNWPRTGK